MPPSEEILNFAPCAGNGRTLVTRKLQLLRATTNSLPSQTNQMYIVGLSNTVFLESWNSYSNSFTLPSRIEVTNVITITITNIGGVLFSNAFFFEGYTGLTVTLGAVVTLFVLMQITAKVDWAEVFARPAIPRA